MATEERLTELEARVEFQDQTITTLNDEIVRHQMRIVDLERSLKLLMERLQNTNEPSDPEREPPPPHY